MYWSLMCFKQDGTISTLSGKHLKLVYHFTYLGGNISSTESNVNIGIGKVLFAFGRLPTIWTSDVCDKIKRELFKAVAVSVL